MFGFVLRLFLVGLPIYCLAVSPSQAETRPIVDHRDPIETDVGLSLSDLVESTVKLYPDSHWLKALEEEAKAIEQRGESWLADAPSLGLALEEAFTGTLYNGNAMIEAPLWNFGQRDAEKALAQQAQKSAQTQKDLIKLRVAGLLRTALWNMSLMNLRYEQASTDFDITQRLVAKVKKLHKLGELSRADSLSVQSELLQKKSILTQSEAEVMHARRRYISMTQSNTIPDNFDETLTDLNEIEQSHPALRSINGLIDKKRAEIETIRLVGSGQTELAVGVSSERGDDRSNETESFVIEVDIPFGGSAHLAPKIAAANVGLNQLIATRAHLLRELEQEHHEAEHNLRVNEAELDIANELEQIAEQQLKMAKLSLSAGEIGLIDFLKIQSETLQAILKAKQRSITLQRDIALYNQSVGMMP